MTFPLLSCDGGIPIYICLKIAREKKKWTNSILLNFLYAYCRTVKTWTNYLHKDNMSTCAKHVISSYIAPFVIEIQHWRSNIVALFFMLLLCTIHVDKENGKFIWEKGQSPLSLFSELLLNSSSCWGNWNIRFVLLISLNSNLNLKYHFLFT